MSFKLWLGMLFLSFFVGMISSVVDGGGGVNVTKLVTNTSATDTSITVQSTQGYTKGYDVLVIGNEEIRYKNSTSNTFTGLTRGYNGTLATSHNTGAKVQSLEASGINSVMGFNIATTGSAVGSISMPIFLQQLVVKTLPQLVTWDYGFLKVGFLAYIRMVLFLISAAFCIMVIVSLVFAVGSMVASIFSKI